MSKREVASTYFIPGRASHSQKLSYPTPSMLSSLLAGDTFLEETAENRKAHDSAVLA